MDLGSSEINEPQVYILKGKKYEDHEQSRGDAPNYLAVF